MSPRPLSVLAAVVLVSSQAQAVDLTLRDPHIRAQEGPPVISGKMVRDLEQ